MGGARSTIVSSQIPTAEEHRTTRTWRMFLRGCRGVLVSRAEPYLVRFLWDLVMGCDGPDWRVGPLWVPRNNR